ncbi:MAG: AMP nucleosidase [Acidimicrobiia bacterium]
MGKLEIARDWLPRYTGMPLDRYGPYVLLTNFNNYVDAFAGRFDCVVYGEDRPMRAATSDHGLSIVNFGIGTANAATIMDLLPAIEPRAVLFLGKCGGLKRSTEIGNFVLPIAAIRGEGTSNEYFPPEVPALPSFELHKWVSDEVDGRNLEYRTGVVYTTNRRVWEHDTAFLDRLRLLRVAAVDMETATLFIVGHHNEIARGALLLVSDVPLTPEGVKTQESDTRVTAKWADVHLDIGIESMSRLAAKGLKVKHFRF